MSPPAARGLWLLKAAYWYNRARFRWLERRLRGRVEFGPGCDVWASGLWLRGQGRAVFGPGTIVENSPFPFVLDLAEGASLILGERTWVRGKYRANVITCFENAALEIGPDSLLNGTNISASAQVTIGRRAMLSWDTVIMDSNLHELENDQPDEPRPVRIGDHVIIGSGATVLPGVEIGSHTVVAAGSVVSRSLPGHVIAAGTPARPLRAIGDRNRCR